MVPRKAAGEDDLPGLIHSLPEGRSERAVAARGELADARDLHQRAAISAINGATVARPTARSREGGVNE